MTGCEWRRPWLHCDAPVAGAAIPPTESNRATVAVCVIHAREAYESGWGIRRLRGGRLEFPDLICECVEPAADHLGGCVVCGLLIVDQALVERLTERHPNAAKRAAAIATRQARQRSVFSASVPDDVVRSGGGGAVERSEPGPIDSRSSAAGCDARSVALSTSSPQT